MANKRASLESITLLGAGLVGSLLAIYLKRKGYHVTVFDKRPDLRKTGEVGGRSINLALSRRGYRALEEVGLAGEVQKLMLPMKGRMMHDEKGNLTHQPYGKEGQVINSISRGRLNDLLVTEAEKLGVKINFGEKCIDVDLKAARVQLENSATGAVSKVTSDIVIGTDGAFSALRNVMQKEDRFNYSQYYLEHGYKEISIPPTASGDFAMDHQSLHIWPRGKFMLIALPNLDKSFTCTLFFPFSGQPSFESLHNEKELVAFFQSTFPDILAYMPDLAGEYFKNPTSSLVTIKCYPWSSHGKTLILGDASHAIVPFYGQGMNAGFEDCRILNEVIEEQDGDWPAIFEAFQKQRKPDADAIATLAFQNFIEMRDKVADPDFLLSKKIEARLHQLFSTRWIPQYSMTTFSDVPYAEALAIGQQQSAIMERVMKTPNIEVTWEQLDFEAIVNALDQRKITLKTQ